MELTLKPEYEINPVGTEHNVTATLEIVNGTLTQPAVNEPIYFEVISGPNAGVNGTEMTDSSGNATFTYTGLGGPGNDTIQANWT